MSTLTLTQQDKIMNLIKLTQLARESNSQLFSAVDEHAESVTALLALDDELEAIASSMIAEGWSKTSVLAAIEEGISP
jgi:signal-transduction protein with cAMP-binding, CBS, and nucleotidyltransferase domain